MPAVVLKETEEARVIRLIEHIARQFCVKVTIDLDVMPHVIEFDTDDDEVRARIADELDKYFHCY